MKTLSKIAALSALALAANVASADVLFQKGGFADLFGGQITGPGGYFQSLGTNATDINLTGLTPGTYFVDYFHNSGTWGSDFNFTIDGSDNITAISTGGNGANPFLMGTGIGTQTLTVNTQSITYNSNSKQTGNWYMQGITGAYATPLGVPVPLTVTPGAVIVDNLYNTGLGTEDFEFLVDGSGNGLASPNPRSGGNPTNAEYITANGSNIDVNTIKVNYHIESTHAMSFLGISYVFTVTNFVTVDGDGPTYIYEFSMDQAMGNTGQLYAGLLGTTILTSNSIDPSGNSIVGNVTAGDLVFAPSLHAHGGMYYFDSTGGLTDSVFATMNANGINYGDTTGTGFVTINATLAPEPASMGLLSLGGAFLLRRRRIA